jgi:hypothetical protein
LHGHLSLLAQARDAQANRLPRTQEHRLWLDAQPDARWRARGNHIARLQAHAATQVGNQLRHIEDQRARVALLVAVAVNLQPQVEGMRVGNFIPGDQPRAERAERIEAFALVPGTAAPWAVAWRY